MSIAVILSQLVIAILVVAAYHVWASSGKQADVAPRKPESPFVPPATAQVAAPPPAPVPVPIPAPAPLPAVVAAETSPEILAVIAAAIAVVVGKPHRVLAIDKMVAGPEINVWALEGRVEQFMSHKIR
jgi:hypothetical protein